MIKSQIDISLLDAMQAFELSFAEMIQRNRLRAPPTSFFKKNFFQGLVEAMLRVTVDANYLDAPIKHVMTSGLDQATAAHLVVNASMNIQEIIQEITREVEIGHSSKTTYDFINEYDLRISIGT